MWVCGPMDGRCVFFLRVVSSSFESSAPIPRCKITEQSCPRGMTKNLVCCLRLLVLVLVLSFSLSLFLYPRRFLGGSSVPRVLRRETWLLRARPISNCNSHGGVRYLRRICAHHISLFTSRLQANANERNRQRAKTERSTKRRGLFPKEGRAWRALRTTKELRGSIS